MVYRANRIGQDPRIDHILKEKTINPSTKKPYTRQELTRAKGGVLKSIYTKGNPYEVQNYVSAGSPRQATPKYVKQDETVVYGSPSEKTQIPKGAKSLFQARREAIEQSKGKVPVSEKFQKKLEETQAIEKLKEENYLIAKKRQEQEYYQRIVKGRETLQKPEAQALLRKQQKAKIKEERAKIYAAEKEKYPGLIGRADLVKAYSTPIFQNPFKEDSTASLKDVVEKVKSKSPALIELAKTVYNTPIFQNPFKEDSTASLKDVAKYTKTKALQLERGLKTGVIPTEKRDIKLDPVAVGTFGLMKSKHPIGTSYLDTKSTEKAVERFFEKTASYSAKRNDRVVERLNLRTGAFLSGAIAGASKGLRERPLKIVGTTALFAGVSISTRLIAKTPIAKALQKSIVLGYVSKSLPLIYGSSIGYRVFSQENYKKKGQKFGEIVTTETIPMIAGSYLGEKLFLKSQGYFKTRGLKEYPIKKLTRKSIISGEKTFPTAAKEKQLSKFLSKKYRLPESDKPLGYHASPEQLKSLIIEPGSSELKGLYLSSEVSPHFLKISGKSKLYGGSILQIQPNPSISAITPEKFIVNPAYKIGKNYVWGSQTKKGYAYLPLIKTEIEAVLTPGTFLKAVNKTYYTKWRGVRIPITKYTPSNFGSLEVVSGGVVSTGTRSPYYLSQAPEIYLTSPESLLLSSIKDYNIDQYSSLKYSSQPKSSFTDPTITTKRQYLPIKKEITPSKSEISKIRSSRYYSYKESIIKSPPLKESIIKPPESYQPLLYKQEKTKATRPPIPDLDFKEDDDKNLYGVSVRRGGVFREIGKFKTQKQAFIRGKALVSRTAAASFKIEDPLEIDPFKKGILSENQFYKSKKEKGVFIEKREKRIKSRGELAEITYKGIFAQKQKQKNKGIFNNIFGG